MYEQTEVESFTKSCSRGAEPSISQIFVSLNPIYVWIWNTHDIPELSGNAHLAFCGKKKSKKQNKNSSINSFLHWTVMTGLQVCHTHELNCELLQSLSYLCYVALAWHRAWPPKGAPHMVTGCAIMSPQSRLCLLRRTSIIFTGLHLQMFPPLATFFLSPTPDSSWLLKWI